MILLQINFKSQLVIASKSSHFIKQYFLFYL
jgi:hypothetical protein